jgi:flagellar assembly protein FliH
MQKYRSADIKTFKFSDLQGTHVVTHARPEDFSFKELTGEVFKKEKISEEALRVERGHEQQSSFRIDDRVRSSRGLAGQEQTDIENRIQQEVQRRLDEAYQAAYNEGLELGRQQGQAEAKSEYEEQLAARISEFEEVISAVKNQADTLAIANRQEMQDFIKRFTKWIILKEIDPKVYLERLLEKLILELNARRNLIIKVGKSNLQHMPEVMQAVESKLGQLINTRVEIVPELQHPGIILEAESGLIDGSLESVFLSIDRIFEQVSNHE